MIFFKIMNRVDELEEIKNRLLDISNLENKLSNNTKDLVSYIILNSNSLFNIEIKDITSGDLVENIKIKCIRK